MTFKKFDNQQVYQISCKNGDDSEDLVLAVGDVIAVSKQTDTLNEVTKITTVAGAMTQLADQDELFLVAQGEEVTSKLGTAYKTYDVGRTVTIEAGETKIVAAYKIDTLENIVGLSAGETKIVAAYKIDTLENIVGLS